MKKLKTPPMGRVDNGGAILNVILAYLAGAGLLPWFIYPVLIVGILMMILRLVARWNSEV